MTGTFKIFLLDRMYPTGVEHLKRVADAVLWDDPGVGRWPDEADGVIVDTSWITAEDLARTSKVRAIAKHGIGLDRIDLAAARARGIDVINTAGANAEACAEMTMTLALTLARRVTEADRKLRAGEPAAPHDFMGHGFEGKTLGIVGMGAIGRAAARKFSRAFAMPVLAYSPNLPSDEWTRLGVEATRVARLEDMLPEVDLLSIHAPLSEHTRHMIGAKEFALMKPTAMLVSTARGGLIDEGALYSALASGRIWGAALDVFEAEPPPPDHPLFGVANFVATPHIAAFTEETMEHVSITVVDLLVEVLEGGKPRTLQN